MGFFSKIARSFSHAAESVAQEVQKGAKSIAKEVEKDAKAIEKEVVKDTKVISKVAKKAVTNPDRVLMDIGKGVEKAVETYVDRVEKNFSQLGPELERGFKDIGKGIVKAEQVLEKGLDKTIELVDIVKGPLQDASKVGEVIGAAMIAAAPFAGPLAPQLLIAGGSVLAVSTAIDKGIDLLNKIEGSAKTAKVIIEKTKTVVEKGKVVAGKAKDAKSPQDFIALIDETNDIATEMKSLHKLIVKERNAFNKKLLEIQQKVIEGKEEEEDITLLSEEELKKKNLELAEEEDFEIEVKKPKSLIEKVSQAVDIIVKKDTKIKLPAKKVKAAKLSVKELKAEAKLLGVKGFSKMTKAQLTKAIKKAEAPPKIKVPTLSSLRKALKAADNVKEWVVENKDKIDLLSKPSQTKILKQVRALL